MLCLPSHTTHLRQPNVTEFNKSVKSLLSTELHAKIRAKCHLESPSMHRHPIIKRSIQISFEHCGIWPFSSIKMVDMIQYESSIPSDVDPIDQGIMGLFSAEVARREAEKDNAAKLRNQTASIE